MTPRSVYYSQVFLTPFMKVSIEAPRESRSFAHDFVIFSLTVFTDAARHTHCTVRVSAPKVVVAARVRGSLHEAVNAASHHLNSPIRQKTCNAHPTMHIHQITFCQLVQPTQQFNKDGCRSLLRTYIAAPRLSVVACLWQLASLSPMSKHNKSRELGRLSQSLNVHSTAMWKIAHGMEAICDAVVSGFSSAVNVVRIARHLSAGSNFRALEVLRITARCKPSPHAAVTGQGWSERYSRSCRDDLGKMLREMWLA